jgi:hypothetical protein
MILLDSFASMALVIIPWQRNIEYHTQHMHIYEQ